MDWQRLFVVPHTLRADYQSLTQAQLCLYSSLIFRNSAATEPQSLLCSVLHLRSHLQVATWNSRPSVLVRILQTMHAVLNSFFVSIVPTGVPRNVTCIVSSTSAVINWHQIDCIERNGVITNYTVVFQEQGGAVIPGEVNVMDRTFTASGLTPHTNYIFGVAGVNSNGTGPCSSDISIITKEDGNVKFVH